MSSEPRHVLIARPAGLSGYAPREWCSVCGKKSSSDTVLKCTIVGCPNTCHAKCLQEGNAFSCAQVQDLRSALNITDSVVYVEEAPLQDEETLPQPKHDEDDGLLELERDELVAIVRQLRLDLAKKNNILGFFNAFSEDIAKHRDAIVTVLTLIDNIAATKSSLEELEVKSVSCTAQPDKIDKDWTKLIQENSQTHSWWTSDNPRKLKKVCHLQESTDCGQQSGVIPPEQPNQLQNHTVLGRNILNSNSGNPRRSIQQNRRSNFSPQNRNSHYNRNNHTSNKQRPIPNQRRQNPRNNQEKIGQGNQTAPQQRIRKYCNHCRKAGHTDDICFNKKKCDYCQRQGHQIENCHTRKNEERQERLFRSLASEQAQNNVVLVQSLQRHLAPLYAVSNQTSTGIGNWQGYPVNQHQGPLHHFNHQPSPANQGTTLPNNAYPQQTRYT